MGTDFLVFLGRDFLEKIVGAKVMKEVVVVVVVLLWWRSPVVWE